MKYSKQVLFSALLMTSSIQAFNLGMIGGQDSFSNALAYSAFVDPANSISANLI